MRKRRSDDELKYPKRPKRAELSKEEILGRMEDLPKRMHKIIAAVRGHKIQNEVENEPGNRRGKVTEKVAGKKKDHTKQKKRRPERIELTPEEILKRMSELPLRKDTILAIARKSED